MPQAELNVFWGDDQVGSLYSRPNGRVRFAYSPEWLAGPALPISISLPCRPEAHDAAVSSNFFDNYIPEGDIKTELARSRHFSFHDIYMFLREFGKDMAGALTIQEHQPACTHSNYEDITATLEDILAKRDVLSPVNLFVLLDANLSLAGAQDKLPVLYRDGRFFLSRGNAPTSHIIKPAHALFRDMPHNEHFCMTLAGKIGLDVQTVDIVRLGGTPVYMIKRFDRYEKNDQIFRLHQEDFCQALSVPAIRKYEEQGGPGWADMAQVILENPFNDRGSAMNSLVDAAVYNFIIGNTDAHGKNFSILHDRQNGHLSLAPLYDICSVYPYGDIIKKQDRMAMSICRKRRMDKLDEDDWHDFAGIFYLSEDELAERITYLADAVENNIHSVLEAHKNLYAGTDVPALVADHALIV